MNLWVHIGTPLAIILGQLVIAGFHSMASDTWVHAQRWLGAGGQNLGHLKIFILFFLLYTHVQ